MYVYFIQSDTRPTAVKIGKAKKPETRLKTLQTGSTVPLRLLGYVDVGTDKDALALEKTFHQVFDDVRLTGEWFKKTANLKNFIHACLTEKPELAQRALEKHARYVERGHHRSTNRWKSGKYRHRAEITVSKDS